MEAQQQKTTLVATAIRFGLVVAISLILADFLLRIANVSFLIYSALSISLLFIIVVVGVALAQRAFRQANSGLMSYGQGVLVAVIVGLITILTSNVFNYLYVNYIDPEFVDRLKDGMVVFMQSHRVPDEKIAESTLQFEELRPPFAKAVLKGLAGGLGGGVILGLIISAFTKRKPADFE